MKFARCIVYSVTLLMLFSCQNGGSSPSASDAAPAKDLNAIAMALVPTTTFVIPTDLNGDCSFDSGVVKDGSSVTAYQNSTVPFNSSCVSEQRTCTAGILSGSYNYSACQVAQAASCLFDGQTIASGDSVIAFAAASVAAGDACTSEVRTCLNGQLSGANAFASCAVDAPAACLFNGQTIASGASVAAYSTSSVSAGLTCSVEYRTCSNGILSGSNQYSSCAVDAPRSCLFNGQNVASGEKVSAYLNSTVPYGSSCQSESRTCLDGTLDGSYQYGNCQVDSPAACLFNGQTIANGQSITAYNTSNVEYGQSCGAETRFCENGHLSGSFEFASCDQGQPASCLFNGVTVPSGTQVTAFATSTVNAPNVCVSEQRLCNNGVLSGSNTFASCVVNAPMSCLFNGKTILDGQTVVAYQNAGHADNEHPQKKSNSTAAQKDKDKHGDDEKNNLCIAENRTCHNGVLSGSFTNTSCQNKKYDDEDDDDEDTIKICKLVVDIKHKQHYEEHPNNGLHLGWLKYKERFNCGKQKGWVNHKNKGEQHDCKKPSTWYKEKDF